MAHRRKGAANEAARTGELSNKRPKTKMGRLEAMLRRPEGATIAQIVSALGWQAHTIRAVISAGLRKIQGPNCNDHQGGKR